ncbi:MAG: hypothetical protein IPJ06_15810 [Saprospiraceae bacterium]|nr:hypothetical protein [Saprospiraceae bacterium]
MKTSHLLRFSWLCLILLLVGWSTPFLTAQNMGGIYAYQADDLREWIILDDEGNEAGTLKMRWSMQYDLAFWDYTFGEHTGEIRARWRDNFREWQVQEGSEIITMRQTWKDIPTEWELTNDGDIQVSWLTRWANSPEEWELREKSDLGRFEVFTAYEGDPRDWVIIDELDPNFSVPVRMGMVFIPILLILPK